MNLERLKSFIQHIENHERGIGSLSIFQNGSEKYKRDFGLLQLPEKERKNRFYHIGSITKTFTATLILNLVQHNKLQVSDKLHLFFPNIKNATEITIEHLLNHSSGLGEYILNNNETWLIKRQKKEDILKFIENSQPLFASGTQQQYSNTAYYLLKEIIELVYGQPYFKALDAVILSKIGISDIYSAEQSPDFVYNSYEYANGWSEIEDFDFANVIGLGDLASDPTSINIFLKHLLSGNIIDPKWVDYMKPLSTEPIFGRGLMTISGGGKPFIGHCGDTYGTHSVMLYNEELDCSISFVLNGTTYSPLVFFDEIVNVLLHTDFQFPKFRNRLSFSDSVLEHYAGFYNNPEFPIQFTFSVRDNVLFAQGTGQPVYALSSCEQHIFEYEIGGMAFHFNADEDKMTFSYAGGEVVFEKETKTAK